MKLRQKLAVVLASAMVVTSIPVVTMAASKNNLVNPVKKIEKNESFRKVTTANAVTIKFEDHDATDAEQFYLELENSEWDLSVLNAADSGLTKVADTDTNRSWTFTTRGVEFTYTLQGSKTTGTVMEVTVADPSAIDPTVSYQFPLLATAKSGDAAVTITPGDSTISETKSMVFATTSDKAISFAIDDTDSLPSFYNSGEIAPIVIKENYTGAISQDTTLEVELEDTDFEFVTSNATEITTGTYAGYYQLDPVSFEAKLAYGFSAGTKAPGVNVYVSKSDKSTATIVLTKPAAETTVYGEVTVSGLEVKSSSRTPEQGKLLANFSSSKLSNATNGVEIATISDYNATLKMQDEKAVEIVAGQIEDVKFSIEEAIEGSFVGGRDFDLEFTAGKLDYRTLITKYSNLSAATKATVATLSDKEVRKLDFDLDLAALRTAGIIDDDYTVGGVTYHMIDSVEFERQSDNQIIPNKLVVTLSSDIQAHKNTEENKMTINVPFSVGINDREVEKIDVKASGRGLGCELSTTAVTVKNPIKVESEAMTVKVGLMNQVGGKVTLSETAKEMFQKGDLTFAVKDVNTVGISFSDDVTLETTGGIKKAEITTTKSDSKAVVSVNRTSNEASAITVKDFKVTVDRTVPEGSYDLEIKGNVLTEGGYEADNITIEDFIVVGTANTEDMIATNGLAKGTSTFVIGQDKYVVNGKEHAMDAKSYIQDPGYTMIPVRYVAEAFGVSGQNIIFSKGKVTIFAGARTIQLTSGSNEAVVNGVTITMGTKVTIKNGRTYAPVGEIARMLGVSTSWDSTAKTATFTNK